MLKGTGGNVKYLGEDEKGGKTFKLNGLGLAAYIATIAFQLSEQETDFTSSVVEALAAAALTTSRNTTRNTELPNNLMELNGRKGTTAKDVSIQVPY